jgi:hypothetical protein
MRTLYVLWRIIGLIFEFLKTLDNLKILISKVYCCDGPLSNEQIIITRMSHNLLQLTIN